MKRYRVNYGLLIGLLASLVVIGAAGYFVLKVQLDRNADLLLRQADAAEEDGKLRAAAGYLYRYYRSRPDEVEPAVRMANTFGDLLSLPDSVPRTDYSNAVNIMETVVRDHGPEAPELRQRLAVLYMRGQRWVDALQHLDILINADARNEELQRLRVTCLLGLKQNDAALSYASRLVGFEKLTGEFDEGSALGPNVVEVYPQLANLLVDAEKDQELGDLVIERMVEVNPDSAKALILRAQYLMRNDRSDEADADLERALEMGPTEPEVLLVNAVRKRELKQFTEARELLVTCVAEHPTNYNAYRELAIIELLETQDLDRATEYIDQGLENVGPGPARTLLFDKARLQADSGDEEGLSETIAGLRAMDGDDTYRLDFLDGRLLYLQRDWFNAAKKFEKIRPIVGTNAEMGGATNAFLGGCYQQLGMFDLARRAFETALRLQPGNQRAAAQLAAVLRRLDGPQATAGLNVVTSAITEEVLKPEAEQDWGSVEDAIDQFSQRDGLQRFLRQLLRADMFARRRMFAEARAEVDQALAEFPDSQAVARADITLVVRDPEAGAVAALNKFDEVVEPKFPRSPAMRLLKADLLIAIDDEALSDQLLSLAADTDDWDEAGRVQLWKGLAQKFATLRNNDLRTFCLRKVAQLAPGELSTLLDLFQVALATGDQAAMEDSQAKILAVVGGKDNPTWLFTEASRLTNEAIRNGNDPELLGRANDLVDRAIGQRPDWHLLYLSRSDIAYARGDRVTTLEALDRADQLGPMTAPGIIRHVTLLTESGRFADAQRVIEKTNPAIRQRLLGKQYAEVLLNVGAVDDALASADKFAESAAANAGAQLWYGRFMRRAAGLPGASDTEKDTRLQKSVQALETTVTLAGESAEAWLDLLITHTTRGDRRAAEEVLRRAQLALPSDQATVVQARGYELVGRFFDAENFYRTLLERQPDDLAVKRQVAAFYLSDRYPRPDKQFKATRLINEILAAAADVEQLDEFDPERATAEKHIRWARRAAAEQFSKTNDYQSLLKAEKLLASNVRGGELDRADRLLMAQILAPRPEPASRLRAIKILESLKKEQGLQTSVELVLGQLYFVTDNWDACRTQMVNTIALNPKLAAARAAYIRMLLRQDDPLTLREAASQLRELQKLAPDAPATAELVARVFTEIGRQEDAVRVLSRLMRAPKSNGETYINIARLMAELGAIDNAEKIYAALAEQTPMARLQYAGFLGQYKDLNKAFDILEELRTEVDVAPIAQVAVGIARNRRDEVGDIIDDRVQQWLDRGLREDPESIELLLQQANFYDLQKDYDGALSIYRQLLEEQTLTRRVRAVVLNNLAYLIAVSSTDPADAEKALGYVAEAVDILGPTADILDTRAVVFIAQGKSEEAIADLNLSLTDNPTASKEFHLARAYLLADDLKSAVDAWDSAIERGLTRDNTAAAERDAFDNLQEKVQAIRDDDLGT